MISVSQTISSRQRTNSHATTTISNAGRPKSSDVTMNARRRSNSVRRIATDRSSSALNSNDNRSNASNRKANSALKRSDETRSREEPRSRDRKNRMAAASIRRDRPKNKDARPTNREGLRNSNVCSNNSVAKTKSSVA